MTAPASPNVTILVKCAHCRRPTSGDFKVNGVMVRGQGPSSLRLCKPCFESFLGRR